MVLHLPYLNETIYLTKLLKLEILLILHNLRFNITVFTMTQSCIPFLLILIFQLSKTVKIEKMMIDCFAHSLHHRSNLTPASKGCEAALRSLFWTLNSLNLLLEMQCEFPFNLMGQTNDNFCCCC